MLARLDDYLARLREHRRTPALALALFHADRVVHVLAQGQADPAAQTPLTPNTLFQIGSITKSFTALAVVQAAEAGRLDLQAPVTHYLPWFQVNHTTRPSPCTTS